MKYSKSGVILPITNPVSETHLPKALCNGNTVADAKM